MPVKGANPRLILASASPRKLSLLHQIGVEPDKVVASEIDETPLKGELPRLHAARLAREKAEAVAASHPAALVLGADTVVACGRRILPKTETEADARACLSLLSGRAHRVYTAIHLVAPGRAMSRISETRVTFKRLSEAEIAAYLESGEWQGKAAWLCHSGPCRAFRPRAVGLPLRRCGPAALRGRPASRRRGI